METILEDKPKRLSIGTLEPYTKAGRLFEYLRLRGGAWVDAGDLAQWVQTTCLSTQVSAVRQYLRRTPLDGWCDVENRQEVVHGKRFQFYRVVREGEQRLLF